MHSFAFLDLDRFYVSTLALQGPTLVHADKRVLDASDDVRALGVRVGMVLAEAKAVARGARCVAWEEEPYRLAQAAWLDVCAEFSDAIEPERQHAAWVDLSGHPDAAGIAVTMAEALGHRVRLGLARTKWIAQVAARAAHPNLPGLSAPCLDAAGYLAPLAVEWLLPVLAEHRERLRFLGYRTIGEVAGLPYRTLEGQFGAEGRRILDAAHGRCFESVRAVYPPDALLERFVFDGATEDSGVLDGGLQALARRVAERLEEKDRCGAEMRVWIEHDSGAVRERVRRFVHPLRTRRSLLAALRAMVEDLREVSESPVTAVRVRLPGLVRAKRVQPQLHTVQASISAESAQHALENVRAVFGDGSVVRGNEVKVPRRVAVLKAWRDVTGWA